MMGGGEMEVAPGKIGLPVSQSRERMMQLWCHLFTHSVSHKDDHTWMHSEEKVHYGGEN